MKKHQGTQRAFCLLLAFALVMATACPSDDNGSEEGYRVTGDGVGDNGAIDVSKTKNVKKGAMVEIIVKPDAGYQLEEGSLKMNNRAGTLELVEKLANNQELWEFEMPAKNVDISCNFVADSGGAPGGQHNVITGGISGGTVTAIPAAAGAGESVTLIVAPFDKMVAGTLMVNAGAVAVTDAGGGVFRFTMPDAAAIVTCLFSGGGDNGVFTVITSGISGGTVTANPAAAKAGDSVTLLVIATPPATYTEGSLKVNDGAVTVTPLGNGVFQFTMPASDATVSCMFSGGGSGPVIPPVSGAKILYNNGLLFDENGADGYPPMPSNMCFSVWCANSDGQGAEPKSAAGGGYTGTMSLEMWLPPGDWVCAVFFADPASAVNSSQYNLKYHIKGQGTLESVKVGKAQDPAYDPDVALSTGGLVNLTAEWTEQTVILTGNFPVTSIVFTIAAGTGGNRCYIDNIRLVPK